MALIMIFLDLSSCVVLGRQDLSIIDASPLAHQWRLVKMDRWLLYLNLSVQLRR